MSLYKLMRCLMSVEDIQVRFFEENKTEGLKWEAIGHFGPQDVHRQVSGQSMNFECSYMYILESAPLFRYPNTIFTQPKRYRLW